MPQRKEVTKIRRNDVKAETFLEKRKRKEKKTFDAISTRNSF